MDSEENRYAHLLKPIRELTKNWDVDVASELNDYLEELDHMSISFDGGKIQLNFAEAALLIQGSTCIYSKKVELLYSLVYQTLDLINDQNKKRDKHTTESEDGGAGRAEADRDADDDVFGSYDKSVASRCRSYTDSTTFVSVAALPPESLLLPETREKQKLPLISLKGDIECSCKDFRMNTFTADALGMIHLVLAVAGQNDGSLGPVPPYHYQDGVEQAAGDAGAGGPDDMEDEAGHDLLPPLEECSVEAEEHVERHQAPAEGRMLRERRDVQPSGEDLLKQKREEQRERSANIWRLHDPTATFGKDAPLKTGKYYRVPDGLDDGGKRKRKDPAVLPSFTSWFTDTYHTPERKLKNGPDQPDLNYIYLQKMKEKLRNRRRDLRKRGVVMSPEELRRTFQQLEEVEEQEAEELEQPDRLHDSDDEFEPLPDDIPAEFGGGAPGDFALAEAELEHLSYEDHVQRFVEQFVVNSQRYGQDTSLSRRVKAWEDKMRPTLAMQEERPVFDIHDYGNRVVAAVGEVGSRRTFSSIVHNMDNFETCKYMLATLQLANDYTVEVDQAPGLEESLDTMGLTLLSSTFKALKPALTAAANGATCT